MDPETKKDMNNNSDWLSENSQNSTNPNESKNNLNPLIEKNLNNNIMNAEKEDIIAPKPNEITSDMIVGPHKTQVNGRGFKIFIILGLVLITIIWGSVFYMYFQNKKLKTKSINNNSNFTYPEVSPTPKFTPSWIKIKNGNVVMEKPDGQTTILIDKSNYPSTGITGFLKVIVSPDEKNICFESWSPSPEPALYLADIDGQNVKKVSTNRQNCLWSNDSKYIYYINTAAKTTPINIFEYDIENSKENDLTSNFVPSGQLRRYEIVGFSADKSKLICKYENILGAATTDNIYECEIDLQTKEVRDL